MSHRQMIEEAVTKYISSLQLDPSLKQKVNWLRTDLYSGPLYVSPNGEVCSFGDEGAKQMNFPALAAEVLNILDGVESIWIETWSGCADYTTKEPDWTDGESEEDWIQLDASDVLKNYLGSELYNTIR